MAYPPPPVNPYQAPSVDTNLVPAEERNFDITLCIKQGYEKTLAYIPQWLLVGLVGTLLMLVSMLTVIGFFVVVPVLAWGMTRFLLNMVDGKPDFRDLFSGFSNYGIVLGRSLALILLLYLMLLLANGLTLVGGVLDSLAVQLLGQLLYLVFAVAVLTRLYFAFFFLVDRDMGPVEALAASWNATSGKVGNVILLAIIAGVIGMAGLLAFCIGVLFTLTMSYVMYASAYRQLTGPPGPAWAQR